MSRCGRWNRPRRMQRRPHAVPGAGSRAPLRASTSLTVGDDRPRYVPVRAGREAYADLQIHRATALTVLPSMNCRGAGSPGAALAPHRRGTPPRSRAASISLRHRRPSPGMDAAWSVSRRRVTHGCAGRRQWLSWGPRRGRRRSIDVAVHPSAPGLCRPGRVCPRCCPAGARRLSRPKRSRRRWSSTGPRAG